MSVAVRQGKERGAKGERIGGGTNRCLGAPGRARAGGLGLTLTGRRRRMSGTSYKGAVQRRTSEHEKGNKRGKAASAELGI